MKKLNSVLLALLCIVMFLPVSAKQSRRVFPWETPPQTYVAHRSLHPDGVAPENSLEAIRWAARAGFKIVEMDSRSTLDGELFVMHDGTVNRTCLYANGKKVKKTVTTSKITFEELRGKYRLKDNNGNVGEMIPTFEEMVKECKANGIYPMVHYHPGDIDRVVKILKDSFGDDFVMFTGDQAVLRRTRELAPNCLIMYGIFPTNRDTAIEFLEEIGGPCAVSTMQLEILDKEFTAECIKRGIDVQASTADYVVLPNLMAGTWTYLLSNWRCQSILKSDKKFFSNVYDFTQKDFATNGAWNGNTIKLSKGQKVVLTDLKTPTVKFGELGAYDVEMDLEGVCNISAPTAKLNQYKTGRVEFSLVYTETPLYLVIEAEEDTVIRNLNVRAAKFK